MPNSATPSDKDLDVSPTFEERLKTSWERYGALMYLVLGAIALAILIKGGLDYLSVRKELAVQRDYAAATAPDMLSAFAERHRGHPLAGVAELKVADIDYGSSKFADAASQYTLAVSDLPAGPFQDRAKLGLAMAQAQSGKAADAETGLRRIVNDEALLKPVRAEAAYHLASLEVSEGKTGEVQKLAEQLVQIDPTSPFAERMMALRATVPEAPSPLLAPAKP
jgi:hypothetical protein